MKPQIVTWHYARSFGCNFGAVKKHLSLSFFICGGHGERKGQFCSVVVEEHLLKASRIGARRAPLFQHRLWSGIFSEFLHKWMISARCHLEWNCSALCIKSESLPLVTSSSCSQEHPFCEILAQKFPRCFQSGPNTIHGSRTIGFLNEYIYAARIIFGANN
jgi:hypothetical protein